MNTLEYSRTSIIGSTSALAALTVMSKARFLLLSDTHGRSDVAEAVIRAFGVDCAGLIFTGDGIPDILQCVRNASKDAQLRSCLPDVLAFVRGNGDAGSYPVSWEYSGKVDELNFGRNGENGSVNAAETIVLPACGKRLLLTHGHRYGVDFGVRSLLAAAVANNASVVCFGHTHRQACLESEMVLAVNAGSAARPRGSGPASCAVINMSDSEPASADFFEIRESSTGYKFFEYSGALT